MPAGLYNLFGIPQRRADLMSHPEPAKGVAKKYWQFAALFPTRQLYKVYWASYGFIFRCRLCSRKIDALEKFRRLCFRKPRTMFARKACISFCKDCDAGLKNEKAKTAKNRGFKLAIKSIA